MTEYRIIVTGCRTAPAASTVGLFGAGVAPYSSAQLAHRLEEACKVARGLGMEPAIVMTSRAGVDQDAAEWGEANDVPVYRYAYHVFLGKRAVRSVNEIMLEEGADLVISFAGCPDLLKRARKAGIPVRSF